MLEISKHAKERYVQRIMSYDDKTEIVRFISEHDEKINTDINKMVEYGDLLYSGKSLKDINANCNIYLKDTWVVIVDTNKNLVVTLYKVDLKVDEEFTKRYISKLVTKLNKEKKNCAKIEAQVDKEIDEYRDIIKENEAVINDYKKTIKSLEEQNAAYKDLIVNLTVNKKVADDKVREILMVLTGNKTW